jgi:APA family basic amino acid/polyamine antiporter
VEAFVTETRPDAEGGELSRSIGLFTLTMFGVGATIGTGIFIVLTEAVPERRRRRR